MTLSSWLSSWLSLRASALKPRSLESYNDLATRYINPALGQVPVDNLTPTDITLLLAQVCAEGHSRTAEMIYVMLRAALRTQRPGLMDAVQRPKHKQQSPIAWSNEQIAVYTAALVNHKHRLALSLAIFLGLRRGEICGLRWQDIDFVNNVIHVVNQRVRLATGEIVDIDPKSESSIRDIPIPPELLPLLKARRQLSGYLCPITPSSLDTVHRTLVRNLGLPYTPLHGLRHTFATACIRNGGDMKCLQLLMGHADYATTANKYTHPDNRMLMQSLACVTLTCYNAVR